VVKSLTSEQKEECASLLQRLSGEIGVVSWEALAPHAERGALFWVDQSLDLAEVGLCVALDDVDFVQAWHEAELLLPAAPSKPEEFAAFRFLIVQPFVLAMPLDLPEANESTT
jgi:hypothetical protein